MAIRIIDYFPKSVDSVEGKSVQFSVYYEGALGNVTYSWKINGVEFSTLKKPEYTLLLGDDGKEVTCQVTDQIGNYKVTSPIPLKVLSKVSLTESPSFPDELILQEGDNSLSFSVFPSGGLPSELGSSAEYTYAWVIGNTVVSTNQSFVYISNPDDNGKNLYCQVTDGKSKVNSSNIFLKTYAALKILDYTPGIISNKEGDIINFSVSTSGGRFPISYSWKLDNVAYSTSRAFQYTYTTADDGKVFTCEVIDNDGYSVKTGDIYVNTNNTDVVITTHPKDLKLSYTTDGAIGLLTVGVRGSYQSAQWYRSYVNNLGITVVEEVFSDPLEPNGNIDPNNPLLLYKSFQEGEDGLYYCTITDVNNNIISSSAAKVEVFQTSTEYLNTVPPQHDNYPFYYPVKDINTGNQIGGPFDTRDPMNIQSTSGLDVGSVYQKVGLWDRMNPFGPPSPGSYNEYFRIGYPENNVREVEKSTNNAGKTIEKIVPKVYQKETINDKKYLSTISVLEKIRRLADLKDARLIDFELLQYFAEHLGWDVRINLSDFNQSDLYTSKNSSLMTPEEAEEAVMKDVRAFVENLPNWYRMKGTTDAVKFILYTFGLVADIIQFYTEDYSNNRQKWATTDVYYNTAYYQTKASNRNEVIEDFSKIPDEWYPTPHFQIRYSINDSYTIYNELFTNESRFKALVSAIHSAKPINTVFSGITGIFRTKQEYVSTIYSIATSYHVDRATTGALVNGEWVTFPIDNPENVDELSGDIPT